ncbi:hypothetical protein SAMN04487969_10614 [Paenibacillus algorifonticola]|uniref:Uncharacterized protein n=1 Tax=Paenibacillus algorifonticola TaxID=684063 RepID=A0A1I2CZS7_9BACL|nr:hypothetical protein SAMN04487969_10614 [Paenibacillus algorifonticola]
MRIEASKQYIFREGQPFQSSHASTVAVLPNGDVLAAWFAGKHEKSSERSIGLPEGSFSRAYGLLMQGMYICCFAAQKGLFFAAIRMMMGVPGARHIRRHCLITIAVLMWCWRMSPENIRIRLSCHQAMNYMSRIRGKGSESLFGS